MDGTFRHVKARHILQTSWFEIAAADHDLVTRLQNAWPDWESGPADDVRIYVNGTPGEGGAVAEVAWAGAWTGDGYLPATPTTTGHPRRREVLDALSTYLWQKNPTLEADIRRFLTHGDYPVLSGVHLPWSTSASLPDGLMSVSTYRYIWHSLYPAAYMLLFADKHSDASARSAANRIVMEWLTRSYYGVDPDTRYAWYDHGTAERLITLLLTRSGLDPTNSDRRTRDQLDEAIVAHAFLLESEAFYAANQRERFHNHAWFQDLALLAAGALVDSAAAPRWLTTAHVRLTDQISRLVCAEGEFAVFVENSVGYHHGIQILVELAAELLAVITDDPSLRATATGLRAWSRRLVYADTRAPSTGDTFRRPNPSARPVKSYPQANTGVTVLPTAGYGVIDGRDAGHPFTICFFATSLSRTHKHADNLSLTLFYAGVEWLIDPSFFSHDYDDAIPAYLRGPAAHSAPFLEGCEYSIEPGLAQLAGGPSDDGYEITGEHKAFEGHLIRRTVRGTTHRLSMTVRDEIIGPSAHTATVRFHLGDGVIARVEGRSVFLSHGATPARLELHLPTEPVLAHGWSGDPITSSVTGTSFREFVDTTTVSFSWTPATADWSLRSASEQLH
ncbi:heparinase II/III domain-containing protein [Cellulomonas carbonis]|uniref:Heparinase II/III-like C-terminal domain-containing protein n=1 Tax=Cellulomonas carbonis T26 TaxID=947969 RepID=A0A0A0BSM8_9CELL|nr:heparinase II/III family protein [Cellulomonas carbonis]KGM11448.1 hypothetical protein N868_08935 [Cellulomonas carbonis T26]